MSAGHPDGGELGQGEICWPRAPGQRRPGGLRPEQGCSRDGCAPLRGAREPVRHCRLPPGADRLDRKLLRHGHTPPTLGHLTPADAS